MKKKYDNLYVANQVIDYKYINENKKGINHEIFISRGKFLVYSKKDENGIVRYYNYVSNAEVFESICNRPYKSPLSDYDDPTFYICNLSLARDYFKEKFKLKIFKVIPKSTLVKLSNLGKIGYVKISSDKDIQQKQLIKLKK